MNKTYQLSFTKKRAMGIIAAVCLLTFLTFTGGLAVGLGLWMPTRSEIALANDYRSRAAGGTDPVQAAAPTAMPSAVGQTPVAAPQPAIPVQTAALHTGSADQPSAAPTETAPPPALPAQQVEMASAGKFALQIGSFTDAKNAKQLETELKDRGYPVRIFKALDPDKKVWHVVRVGDYTDVSTASRAAAEFTSREQLQALVRRADAL